MRDAQVFYVLGTIHLPDSRLDAFPPGLEAALQESDTVFTEIPMTPEAQAAVAPLLVLPPGRTLSQALPAPLHSGVMEAFGARGVPASSLENLKPWVVAIQLALLDRLATLAQRRPLDSVIYEKAALAGKVVKGLESPREQLALFDTLSHAEQIELLRQTLEFRNRMKVARRDMLGELLEAYVAGDDALVAGLMREGYDPKDRLSAKLLKRVFTDRNAAMVSRMLSQRRSTPKQRHFFAVGAGHVVGDDGIVARLERRGFKVERVE
ncbi:MAG TPA: TraB/GumN family protein [Polyangiaceae bacterium]|nr:TraB/GumN family protein [Polyangiaceae bacterium]